MLQLEMDALRFAAASSQFGPDKPGSTDLRRGPGLATGDLQCQTTFMVNGERFDIQ